MNTDTISPPPTNTTLREHLQSLDEAITASGSHNGISLHQYVARHGKPFESTELTAEEEALISQIDFRNCQPRQCYRNCQMAALTLPLPPGHTLRYAEGFFAMNWNIGIEHAWLTLNGKLVDPTLRTAKGAPILGTIPEGHQYIGIEIDRELCQHIIPHQKHISLLDDYECGRPLLDVPPSNYTKDLFPDPSL